MTLFGPAVVYSLCLAASVVCATLLIRAFQRARSSLLFWTAASFVLIAFNNLLLVVDMLVFPTSLDLYFLRQSVLLAAVGVLLYGFIREVR